MSDRSPETVGRRAQLVFPGSWAEGVTLVHWRESYASTFSLTPTEQLCYTNITDSDRAVIFYESN